MFSEKDHGQHCHVAFLVESWVDLTTGRVPEPRSGTYTLALICSDTYTIEPDTPQRLTARTCVAAHKHI